MKLKHWVIVVVGLFGILNVSAVILFVLYNIFCRAYGFDTFGINDPLMGNKIGFHLLLGLVLTGISWLSIILVDEPE